MTCRQFAPTKPLGQGHCHDLPDEAYIFYGVIDYIRHPEKARTKCHPWDAWDVWDVSFAVTFRIQRYLSRVQMPRGPNTMGDRLSTAWWNELEYANAEQNARQARIKGADGRWERRHLCRQADPALPPEPLPNKRVINDRCSASSYGAFEIAVSRCALPSKRDPVSCGEPFSSQRRFRHESRIVVKARFTQSALVPRMRIQSLPSTARNDSEGCFAGVAAVAPHRQLRPGDKLSPLLDRCFPSNFSTIQAYYFSAA